MSAKRWVNGRPLPLRSVAGYSLVEMVIALGMAVVVGAGLFAVYNAQQNASRKQRETMGLQTECNLVMDQMKQELLLAGYRGDETTPAKTFADATVGSVTFEYFDDKAKYNDAATTEERHDSGVPWDSAYSGHTQIQYALNGSALERKIKRWHRATSTYGVEGTQVLADNIFSLAFKYDRGDNTTIPMPASPSDLNAIRNIKIDLVCRSPKVDPVSGKQLQVALTASVAPRNVGLEANPRDITPPAPPAELVVWDLESCGGLRLRWKANTEADLEGYTIFYGLSSGSYAHRARLTRGPGTAGAFEYYTLTGLTATTWAAANATPPIPAEYHFVITAFDKSGNQSSYSSEVANAAQSVTAEPAATAFGSASSDTVINPGPPPDPATFTAAPPPHAPPPALVPPEAENKLVLSWSPVVVEGLQGYRLYRSQVSADFTPIGIVKDSGNCIAGIGELGPTAVSWTDSGLQGCETYYYKIVAVHCDDTLPIGSRGAKATGVPLDVTPPATPEIIARAGYGRITLSLKNGTDADFDYTKVYFNKGAPGSNNFPVRAADGTVSNGGLIPDAYPWPSTKGPGVYDAPGSQPGINFNDETNGDPTWLSPGLSLTDEFFFIAVSFDFCGNPSPAAPISQTAGRQCSDCVNPPDPVSCVGAPPSIAIITASGCFGTDGITLSWDYNYLSDTDLTGNYRDLAGFHVWRREGDAWGDGSGAVELTDGTPIWFTNYQDAGGAYSPPQDGKVYSYLVMATDCYWEQHHGNLPSTWPDPLNDPNDNHTDTLKTDLYVGRPVFEPFFGSPNARLVSITVNTDVTLVDIGVRSLSFSAEQFAVVAGVRTVTIETEQFACTGATAFSDTLGSSKFTGCTRGVNATVIADHPVGSTVTPVPASPPVDALTGMLLSDNVDTRFRHSLVNLRLKNTAAGRLDPQNVTATWQNPNVHLRQVSLGDGLTTPEKTSTGDSADNAPFGLVDTQLDALDEEVPLGLTFLNLDGTDDASTDMRSDLMTVALSWTNPTMDSTVCTVAPVSRTVPPGPIVSSVTLSQPSEGTIAQAIPDNPASPTLPNAIIVPGTLSVHVFAEVLDTSQSGLSAVKLFFKADNGSAPPPITGVYPNFTDFEAIDMVYVAGNEWRTPVGAPIEPHDGSSVWFFVVAVDNNGDFDREPEIDRGAFEYYQQIPDVCNNFPRPPSIVGDETGGIVTLTITDAPTNTDGSPRSDFGGHKVFRSVNGGSWTLWKVLPQSTLETTDTDSTSLLASTISYYATSIDTCVPANESTASNIFSECIGAPPCSVNITSSNNPIYPGNSLGISVSVCSKKNGSSGERIWAQSCSLTTADADAIRLLEDGDTGSFTIDSADSGNGGQTTVSTYLPADYPSPPFNVDLKVEPTGTPPTDTVRINGYSDLLSAPSGWDDACISIASATCYATIGVIPDPCLNPVTPTMAAVTASFTANNCNASNNNVRLTWALPTSGTYTHFHVYRCNGASCDPTVLYADSVTTDADAALADFQWIDSNPGGKLDAASVRLHYKVTAVNDKCATDIKETPLTSVTKVNDGCGTN